MFMNEALLQFIWRYSLYKPVGLQTTNGEPVTVIFPGTLNRNAGPDFLDARIKVGNATLAGNVELHVNSSDWTKHNHQHDDAYKPLALHVVYRNDAPDVAAHVPMLVLAPHIPHYVMERYTGLLKADHKLPCNGQHDKIKDITKESWLSRMLAERWEQKLGDWNELLTASKEDWRNLLYWRTAANFGFKVNATPFLMLARSLPLNILARHHDNLLQIEALLFGQAGMLHDGLEEEYPQQLYKEYNYLRQKYNLTPITGHLWKFLRMRPANFPTIRIAQFAALVHKSVHLFSQILEVDSVKEIMPLLDVRASGYWDTHFTFDEVQKTPTTKRLGKSSIHNIIINTIAPIRFLYAHKQGEASQQERALQLLDAVPAEQNNILKLWKDNGWEACNAGQSQALLQLYNNYCSSKRCLECTIGLNVIRSVPVEN